MLKRVYTEAYRRKNDLKTITTSKPLIISATRRLDNIKVQCYEQSTQQKLQYLCNQSTQSTQQKLQYLCNLGFNFKWQSNQ